MGRSKTILLSVKLRFVKYGLEFINPCLISIVFLDGFVGLTPKSFNTNKTVVFGYVPLKNQIPANHAMQTLWQSLLGSLQ